MKVLISRFFGSMFRSEARWMRWLVAIILLIYFLGQNTPVFQTLKTYLTAEQLTFSIGTVKLSAFSILHGLMTIIAVFWVGSLISAWGESSINRLKGISTNSRRLLVSGLKVLIFFVAGMVCLNALGINLTSLTIFSGAIGIGLGFGLQKITSNFISGLILLIEKSLEEGDLVELSGGYQGIVKKMGARYTLIETFDSKEIMIPNEDFITNRVTNWTFTNTQGRIEILLGVSYDSDIEKARELILDAAREHPRCSQDPEPQCFLVEYGTSSVNFQLYLWVDDVTAGRLEPRSDVMRAIWRKFKENGIGIPFPQSDVFIKNLDQLRS